MVMDNKEFCYHLEQWKERTGKKDIDFCRLINVHPNTLVNWKKGKSAPQAEKMKKICEAFRINENDLSPLSFFTAQSNENKLYYRTQQLQRYAREKGLDEGFYKQLVSKPYFLREFPFSSTKKSRFSLLDRPAYLEEDEEYMRDLDSIPLSKYEFEDAYGHIMMLNETDIDFLVRLQRKSEQSIRDEMCLEMKKQDEQKLRRLVEFMADDYLEDGEKIDIGNLFDSLTQVDFTERVLTGRTIWDRFDVYVKKHKLQHKPFRQYMLEHVEDRHPPMSSEEKQAWREHYAEAGFTEDEINEWMQRIENRRQRFIDMEKDVYKEDEDNGQH